MKVTQMIRVNGEMRPWEGGTLAQLLATLGHDTGKQGIAVAINGEVVTRTTWKTREILAGDAVEVVGAVQGG